MLTKEEYYQIYSKKQINHMCKNSDIVCFKGSRPVLLGKNCLLKVNLNIGASTTSDFKNEIEKVNAITKLNYRPDSIMDLSIMNLSNPLWKFLHENFDGAVGAIPHYIAYSDKAGIDENLFFETLYNMAENGVSFVTLHLTANVLLYKEAQCANRITPTTSRGGYILIKDQIINNREENFIALNFLKIINILKKYGMGLSVGSTFRPASIDEALDSVHLKEIANQNYYINIAKQNSIPVIMEGIGHISCEKIPEYANIIRPFNTPLMPLGPIPSDELIGFDHISNAIGTTLLAQTGVVGMINSITREEHTGKIPSIESALEGLKTAVSVAHCYNICKFQQYKIMTEISSKKRAENNSCIQKGGLFNYTDIDDNEIESCTRCRHECPLKKILF